MPKVQPDEQDKTMLYQLFGWHAVPWTEAFCEAVSFLETPPRTVLEVGAARLSAPSLYFLSKGAAVDITCYASEELPSLRTFCRSVCEAHQLPMPSIGTHDVFSMKTQTYDLILLKGVLGGLDRSHNLKQFAKAIECCKRMLSEGGRIIILDKGWCSPIHNLLLNRFGDAGRADWHYFTQDELISLAAGGPRPLVMWKGFASLGIMPSKGLQWLADLLDTRIFNRFLSRKGTVFAALYGK